tara:strand:+ start:340 stop:678 length:339 start_codon:yes stop_codon:yes gene_type:complete
MRYELEDDEMALVIKPLYEANGEWEGDVATGVAMNESIELDRNIQRGMVHIITLMTAFLSYSDDKEDLVDEVLLWRDKLFADLEDSPLAEYETKEDARTLLLTKFTKTKGSA